jgi:osmotically-inducible protein OsmY
MDRKREQHRGRGPKGYRRSDERIREDVNDRLSDDYYLDASDIEVAVSETVVTLTGTVLTRADKRRAEDIADDVSGVTNVENRLRVSQSSLDRVSGIGTSETSSTSTTGTASRSRTAGT